MQRGRAEDYPETALTKPTGCLSIYEPVERIKQGSRYGVDTALANSLAFVYSVLGRRHRLDNALEIGMSQA